MKYKRADSSGGSIGIIGTIAIVLFLILVTLFIMRNFLSDSATVTDNAKMKPQIDLCQQSLSENSPDTDNDGVKDLCDVCVVVVPDEITTSRDVQYNSVNDPLTNDEDGDGVFNGCDTPSAEINAVNKIVRGARRVFVSSAIDAECDYKEKKSDTNLVRDSRTMSYNNAYAVCHLKVIG